MKILRKLGVYAVPLVMAPLFADKVQFEEFTMQYVCLIAFVELMFAIALMGA